MSIDPSLFMSILKGAHNIEVPEDRATRVSAITDAINAKALAASDAMPFEAEASRFFVELEREE